MSSLLIYLVEGWQHSEFYSLGIKVRVPTISCILSLSASDIGGKLLREVPFVCTILWERRPMG